MQYQDFIPKRSRTKSEKGWNLDYEQIFKKEPVRLVLGAGAIIVGIYVSGKVLRLLGGTVRDVRSFTNSLRG